MHAFYLSLANGALLAGASAAHAFYYRFHFHSSGTFGLRHCMEIGAVQRLTCPQNNGPTIATEVSQIKSNGRINMHLFRCQLKRGR